MKPHQFLCFFAIFALLVHFEPSLAYPVAPPTPPNNSSVQYDRFGLTAFESTDMEDLLDKNPFFLRDTVSNKFVEFDIPRGATGFYPIIITFSTTTPLSFISINSTSNVDISLYKCGKVKHFGRIRRGHILFNKTGIQELETERCGRQWKNQFIKLVITPVCRRAQGYARVDGHYYTINGTQSFFALIGLSFGVVVIILLFVLSICLKPREKISPSIPPRSESFEYHRVAPQEPIPMLRRSESQVTIFEHEREEMALAQRVANYHLQNEIMVRQRREFLARRLEQEGSEEQEGPEELDVSMHSVSSGDVDERYTGVEEEQEDHTEFYRIAFF